MKKLLLIILLIIGFSYPQGINTSVIYLLENYNFQGIDADTIAVDRLNFTSDETDYSIYIDRDMDYSEIGDNYPGGIYIDLQQTAGVESGAWNAQGGMYGINSRIHIDDKSTGGYAILGRAYIDSDEDINDVYGIMGEIRLTGNATRGATTSSISAVRGSVSNLSTGTWEGQMFGLMLDFGANMNFGDESALIFGYSHGDAYLDYGMHLLSNSTTQNMVAGIYLEAATGATISKGIELGGAGYYTVGMDFDGTTAGADENYMSTDFDFTQGIISSNAYENRGNITGVRTDVVAIGNIDHVWALRSGASMAMEGDSETNQFYGGMVSVSASGAHTLTLHDGLVGLQTTVGIDASVTDVTGGLVAALFTNSEPIHLDVDSPTYNIYAKVGGYTDYGIAVQIESNNVLSGIRIKTIDNAIIPVGLEFEDTSGNIKADIKTSSGAFIFSGSSTTGDAIYAEVGAYDATGSIYITTNGALYVQVANAGSEADWYKVTTTNAD